MDCGRADIEFDLVVFDLLVDPSYDVYLLDARLGLLQGDTKAFMELLDLCSYIYYRESRF
jgi:hypothetical protein